MNWKLTREIITRTHARHVVAARSRRSDSRMAIERYLTHLRNLHEVKPARPVAAELGIGFRTAPITFEFDRAPG